VPTASVRRRKRRGRFLPYLLLTPALVLLIGMVYPFGLGLYYSLTDYWLQFPKRFHFIGLGNYTNLFGKPLFTQAVEFTLGYTLVAVTIQVGLGLAVALFLHARIPGRKTMRAMMLMPLMIPPVIAALMWKVMMDSTRAGILNYLLSFIGVDPVNWLGSPHAAVVSVLIIDTWGNLPFVSLILLGGLQALPTEPYEAARVDGAGPAAMLRYITLPLLLPFIILAATFRVMDSLRIFDVIYATTMGGPDDATTNLSIMSYQYAFQWYQMGMAVAETIVLLAMVVIASYVLLRMWNRSAEGAAQ
jgi:multiple sugar transport system permease protein